MSTEYYEGIKGSKEEHQLKLRENLYLRAVETATSLLPPLLSQTSRWADT
jgi:hypothetical protein